MSSKTKIGMFLFLFILLIFSYGSSKKHERYYQEKFCSKLHGRVEYTLQDRTRVDCLTEEYAIEVDFEHKWAEAVGQSLYYSLMTGKKPGILIIKENGRHIPKIFKLCNEYGITLWIIEEEK